MRFYPFGSGSIIPEFVSSSRYSSYAQTAGITNYVVSASVAQTASVGPPGDPGSPSTFHGPYEYYPQP